MEDIIKLIARLFVLCIVVYIVYILAGALVGTFGIFAALGFIVRCGYAIYTDEALDDPRSILLLFGFSIISGVAGLIFFDSALPAILKGDWLSFFVIIIIVLIVYFGFREKLLKEFEGR